MILYEMLLLFTVLLSPKEEKLISIPGRTSFSPKDKYLVTWLEIFLELERIYYSIIIWQCPLEYPIPSVLTCALKSVTVVLDDLPPEG